MNTTAAYGMSPFIRCLTGEYAGYDVPILQTGILIGRDPSACHLIFDHTSDVSRFHCRVSYSEKTGYFVITDLNSLNGVFAEDGCRVATGEKLVLGPGQRFGLCDNRIVFETLLRKDD